jgi:hypothetical protein
MPDPHNPRLLRAVPRAAARGLLMLAMACVLATAAHATLGGDRASVEADRLQMHAPRTARLSAPAAGAGYTVHETTLPTGTLVRQYVSAAGSVFAVAWSGPFKPDLQQLLGPHFAAMLARQDGQVHAGRPFVRQHGSDLVVESGGHPNGFVGRAYLPAALPAGVTAQDIQ